ncbi:DUF4350 domain-containing protein [Kordia zhangzhouensis]|uniref:DUF4350 domain-containing protein n=1 Tax=Kordia zhangzhouensis TaxID=1620405 RepID=UPI0006290D9D|nr:DUF4350 domain-containing protein [Kordia zhangzhouensis]
MNRTLKIYLGVLIFIIIAAMFFEVSSPATIDWRETYNERQTKPFDLEVFHKELANVIDEGKIKNIYRTPYEFFNANYDWDMYKFKINGTYLNINPDSYMDEPSLKELLDFAYEGNTVFISSREIPDFLKDSLNFTTEYKFEKSTKADLSFANYTLKYNNITATKGIKNIYFSSIDTTYTIPLGFHKFEKDSTRTNFIKIPFGDGALLLHTQPAVFTNFHLLKDDRHKYVEAVLGYIPKKDIFFDSPNKIQNGEGISKSRLRFILQQPALRWAWYIALLFLIIFIVFNAKRKQRIVKVINPLPNTTVDFTKTIGNLFYETKDHENVVQKKITYFLEHLRTEYLMDTQVLDEKFCTRLSQKTGKPKEEIERLVKLIQILQKKLFYDENDVLNITKAIEDFKKR